jgi:hypothetical protein
MPNPRLTVAVTVTLLFAGLLAVAPRPAASARVSAAHPPPKPPTTSGSTAVGAMTLDQARQTVSLLDDAYQTELHEIHRWYPARNGQPVVAASLIRKLQVTMGQKGWPQSRFIGVRGVLMNPDHKPRDTFEQQAADKIRAGAERVETVERGRLRVATVLPMGGGCNSCHWEFGRSQDTKAAISFTIPLKR